MIFNAGDATEVPPLPDKGIPKQWVPGWLRWPVRVFFLGWLFKFWNIQFQGFYLRSEEEFEYEKHSVMIMGCRYLQKDGSCKHHTLRPMVCRKWPAIEQFGHPRILKGCGFKAVPRKTSSKNPLQIFPD